MTYEKATALFLAAPHLLDGVGTVVVDEAQMPRTRTAARTSSSCSHCSGFAAALEPSRR